MAQVIAADLSASKHVASQALCDLSENRDVARIKPFVTEPPVGGIDSDEPRQLFAISDPGHNGQNNQQAKTTPGNSKQRFHGSPPCSK